MHLPELIEILPLANAVRAQITVPGSKSITNRALIAAALSRGQTTLEGALWSEDTQVMVEALQTLGFELKVELDAQEFCNRNITVTGCGGQIPRDGTSEKPLEIFVANAGTAARFVAALVCMGNGVYRLHGTARMHERPQAALFQALRELGYQVEGETNRDKLPARIFGSGPFKGPGSRSCSVSITHSSQFASGLLLCASAGNWTINVVGENPEESPYVEMTSKLIKSFPKNGGHFPIEPDASSGSYFHGAGYLISQPQWAEVSTSISAGGKNEPIQIVHWPKSRWQIDAAFPEVIKRSAALWLGLERQAGPLEEKPARQPQPESMPGNTVISRRHDLGDSIMMAIVLTPFALHPIQFSDLGRLRLQECERVAALRTELTRCGAKVVEQGDTLTVFPSSLHGAEIETYNDHRVAMCFAILGLKVPGIKIKNPSCVKKTFPNFFQKLAALPPQGLGAVILDAKSGRALAVDELFAD